MDIFLSYSRVDLPIAEPLARSLENSGAGVFIDTRHIAAGSRWDTSVQNALSDCKSIVVLLTPDAVRSENVLDEVSYALDFHKMIVPVMVRNCSVPFRLRRFEWISYENDIDQLATQLLDRINMGHPMRKDAEPARSDRPSLVVLPIKNLSNENQLDAFCQGLVNEIIQTLSLSKEFFIIASGTSLTYQSTARNLKQISNELGVRYAVTGTLQHNAGRLRVNIELSNAETERVLWANHYDGRASDYFEMQDEISRAIAVQLQPRLVREEIKRVVTRPTNELSAWELFQRARTYDWSYTWLKESIGVLRQAIELDPKFAQAHALLGARLAYMIWHGEFEQVGEALDHLKIALDLQPADPFVQVARCIVNLHTNNPQEALEASEKALEANPNLAEAWAYCGMGLALTGKNLQGLEKIDMAFRLSPKDPLRYLWQVFRLCCYVGEEMYEEAEQAARESISLNKDWFFVYMSQAVNHAMLGSPAAARSSWAEAKKLNSLVSLEAYQMWLGNSQLTKEHQHRLIDALRSAECS